LSSITCPKCGTSNVSTAGFCSICGNPLVSVPSGQPVTPSPPPSIPATPAPNPYYQYAAGYYATARATGIDRTKTGLLLLVIGFFLGWIPVAGAVGGLLELIGAILVILGRHTFGPEHARNVIWSIIIFVIAIVVAVVAVVVVVFSALSTFNPNNPVAPQAFASSFMNFTFVIILVGAVIFGLAEVLFTYALQKSGGQLLLWCGYVSTIAVASIGVFVLNSIPYLSNALSIVPALFYGYAYYLARDRIVRGEIPAPAAPQPGQGTPASNI